MSSSTRPRLILTSLPVELQAEIVTLALDDGRWWDLSTAESLMLVCKGMWELAAPVFWRDVSFGAKSQADLDEFLHFRPSVFPLVRTVTLGSHTDPLCTDKQCDVICRLPSAEHISLSLSSGDEETHHRLARTVYPALKRVNLHVQAISRARASPASDDAGAEGVPAGGPALCLDHLAANGAKPEELTLLLFKVDHATVQALSDKMASVRSLKTLHILQFSRESPFPLPAFGFSPLRSLQLDWYDSLLDVNALHPLLQDVASTLEHLSVCAWLSRPLPPVHLSKLRQLKIGTGNPIDFLYAFRHSPIEILEIIPRCMRTSFSLGDDDDFAQTSCLASFQALSRLEVFISNEDIVDNIPPHEIKPVFSHIRSHGIDFLDRTIDGEDEPAWRDILDDFDTSSVPRRLGGVGYVRDEDFEWRTDP
ncbi:hypothetical protein JCM8097_003256 [Rhodosporidiobolus ruineniae]